MDLSLDTLWFEIAIVCGMTAIGTIFFDRFERHSPKYRRVLKLVMFNVIVVLLSKYLGRIWAFGFLGVCLLAVVYIHAIWLPKKGINGWTGEPWEKYFELRGWDKSLKRDR